MGASSSGGSSRQLPTTSTTTTTTMLLLILGIFLPLAVKGQELDPSIIPGTYEYYVAIAENFETTPEEFLGLGGLQDENCTFAFNATADNCEALIEAYETGKPIDWGGGGSSAMENELMDFANDVVGVAVNKSVTFNIISPVVDEDEEVQPTDISYSSSEDPPPVPKCGCYNFCAGKIMGCFEYGQTPPLFQCPITQVVAGCQKGGEEKKSPLTPISDEEANPCPPGYMCAEEEERSCEEIRQIPIDLGLGDVHAGMYCPGADNRTVNGLEHCPAGSYCPNSTTKLPCPAGFYCPHKTFKPDIKCSFCGEGVETLSREPAGYIAAAVIFVLVCLFVLWELFRRKNAKLLQHLVDLRARQTSAVKDMVNKKRRQEKLEKLLPKLQAIERRLKQSVTKSVNTLPSLSEDDFEDKSEGYLTDKEKLKQSQQEMESSIRDALNTNAEDGSIRFDARSLFDLMDRERTGELTFVEINRALELSPLQFKEFTHRMNQAAVLPPDTETVKRIVFVKNFLRVLEQISHFQPTEQEAEELFDDILEARGEATDLDGIPHECLFSSPLADFLDEQQIQELIKRFQKIQEDEAFKSFKKNNENAGGSSTFSLQDNSNKGPSTFRRISMAAKFMSKRRLTTVPTAAGRRRSTMMQAPPGTPQTRNSDPPQQQPSTPDDRRARISDSVDIMENNPGGGTGHVKRARRQTNIGRKVKRTSLIGFIGTNLGGGDNGEDDLEDVTPENMLEFDKTKWKRPVFSFKPTVITREEFVTWYPSLLTEITTETIERVSMRPSDFRQVGGVDIAFQDLSLTVSVKKSTITIVDKVTGRLQTGTMTALMGGSGAGKTSLLNALCGRAHYGDVTGTVYINGHKTSIEEHSSAVGFVPQDDIVYAELTVRENFIFSGKFMLPSNVSMAEIEDLADSTMASLGLSRVMHSMVGDVNRRGVSGGEKKRVNIGLELMSKPKILFLDEPTSGLDSNSALLVMSSLKTLVSEQGTTVCSVIHQPRKFIFELFDSLVLLGVGGKMVYHGPVSEAEAYFTRLNYELPPGEALADWLIDISSGAMEPKERDEELGKGNSEHTSKTRDSVDSKDSTNGNDEMKPLLGEESKALNAQLSEPSGAEFENDASRAKSRREVLYKHWNKHFKGLSEKQMEIYNAPEPYNLPEKREMKPFMSQLIYQIHRIFVVGQRNWTVKVIDTVVIVFAVVLICSMDGTLTVTREDDLNDLRYSSVAQPTSVELVIREFPKLFRYAIRGIYDVHTHNAKLAVLVSVLVALSATKLITDKRKEFFREAGSGYNINAYFCAVNVMATIEYSIQILICAIFAIWLRSSLSHLSNYLVSFLMLGWVTVSWAILFPFLVPIDSVTMVTGFFCVIMSLLFSGASSPVQYSTIYGSDAWAIVSGIFSPARFFIEAQEVAEARTLPTQSGFTTFGSNFRGDALQTASFQIMQIGMLDFGNIVIRSFDGWYWGAAPAFMVGLLVRWAAAGTIHLSERPRQSKKSLLHTLKKDPSGWISIGVYACVFLVILIVTIYLLLAQRSTLE